MSQKNPWEFKGIIDCDLCLFWCGDVLPSETSCSYLAGWKAGQKKFLEYLIENPEVLAASNKITFIDRLKSMLGLMEEKDG